MADTASSSIRPVDPTAPPSTWKRAVVAVAASTAGTSVHRTVAARLDPHLLRASGGRLSFAFGAAPVVLLTARGARTGRERTVPLLYFNDGPDVVLVASSYGRARHPAWYRNLVAHPECELRTGSRGGRYVAREVHGEDRDRLYVLARRFYAGYGNYATKTEGVRTIPVLRLAPTPS
jgi:deazaflavin-dependent oxidoreductase (nitroreductase family)